jgi:hypothetical protein
MTSLPRADVPAYPARLPGSFYRVPYRLADALERLDAPALVLLVAHRLARALLGSQGDEYQRHGVGIRGLARELGRDRSGVWRAVAWLQTRGVVVERGGLYYLADPSTWTYPDGADVPGLDPNAPAPAELDGGALVLAFPVGTRGFSTTPPAPVAGPQRSAARPPLDPPCSRKGSAKEIPTQDPKEVRTYSRDQRANTRPDVLTWYVHWPSADPCRRGRGGGDEAIALVEAVRRVLVARGVAPARLSTRPREIPPDVVAVVRHDLGLITGRSWEPGAVAVACAALADEADYRAAVMLADERVAELAALEARRAAALVERWQRVAVELARSHARHVRDAELDVAAAEAGRLVDAVAVGNRGELDVAAALVGLVEELAAAERQRELFRAQVVDVDVAGDELDDVADRVTDARPRSGTVTPPAELDDVDDLRARAAELAAELRAVEPPPDVAGETVAARLARRVPFLQARAVARELDEAARDGSRRRLADAVAKALQHAPGGVLREKRPVTDVPRDGRDAAPATLASDHAVGNAGGCGLRGEPGAERVTGERPRVDPGGDGGPLDDERDGAVAEPPGPDGAVPLDAPEERAGVDSGGLAPCAHGGDRAELAARAGDAAAARVRDPDLEAAPVRVRLRALDEHDEPVGDLANVRHVERDELGPPERASEPEQQERPVALPGDAGAEAADHPREAVEPDRVLAARRAHGPPGAAYDGGDDGLARRALDAGGGVGGGDGGEPYADGRQAAPVVDEVGDVQRDVTRRRRPRVDAGGLRPGFPRSPGRAVRAARVRGDAALDELARDVGRPREVDRVTAGGLELGSVTRAPGGQAVVAGHERSSRKPHGRARGRSTTSPSSYPRPLRQPRRGDGAGGASGAVVGLAGLVGKSGSVPASSGFVGIGLPPPRILARATVRICPRGGRLSLPEIRIAFHSAGGDTLPPRKEPYRAVFELDDPPAACRARELVVGLAVKPAPGKRPARVAELVLNGQPVTVVDPNAARSPIVSGFRDGLVVRPGELGALTLDVQPHDRPIRVGAELVCTVLPVAEVTDRNQAAGTVTPSGAPGGSEEP